MPWLPAAKWPSCPSLTTRWLPPCLLQLRDRSTLRLVLKAGPAGAEAPCSSYKVWCLGGPCVALQHLPEGGSSGQLAGRQPGFVSVTSFGQLCYDAACIMPCERFRLDSPVKAPGGGCQEVVLDSYHGTRVLLRLEQQAKAPAAGRRGLAETMAMPWSVDGDDGSGPVFNPPVPATRVMAVLGFACLAAGAWVYMAPQAADKVQTGVQALWRRRSALKAGARGLLELAGGGQAQGETAAALVRRAGVRAGLELLGRGSGSSWIVSRCPSKGMGPEELREFILTRLSEFVLASCMQQL